MDSTELRKIIRITRNESDDFADYLDTLSEDQWGMPSACEGWTVADVLGHVLFVYKEICTDWVSRGLQGDVSVPDGYPSPGVSDQEMDTFLFEMAKNYSREYAADLLPEFRSYAGQVCQLWGTLNSDNWNMPSYRGRDILPITSTITIPFRDVAMHHWDIRSRLDPQTAYLSADSVNYYMESVRRFRLFKPGTRLSSPERYRFELDARVEPGLDFVIEGDKAHVEPSGSGNPDVIFRCSGETLVLIYCGRLGLDTAVSEAGLSYEGDANYAHRFFGWLRNL